MIQNDVILGSRDLNVWLNHSPTWGELAKTEHGADHRIGTYNITLLRGSLPIKRTAPTKGDVRSAIRSEQEKNMCVSLHFSKLPQKLHEGGLCLHKDGTNAPM